MGNNYVRLKGRPVMASGKRIKKIDVRFTQQEFDSIVALEKTLGITKTDLIRMRVLQDSTQLVINAKEFMLHLDTVGADLGRIGNNINQLARYANTLNKRGGLLSPQIIERFNVTFSSYVQVQQELEIVMRKLIRSMGN